MTNPPAEPIDVIVNNVVPAEPLTDSQKLDLIYQHVEWLTIQVGNILAVAQTNPMFRMMMARRNK